MYSFVIPIKKTLLILITLLLPFLTSSYIFDINNAPLISGEPYYIITDSTWTDLTYYQKDNICPLYITLGVGSPGNFHGPPVKFSTSTPGDDTIYPNSVLGISFASSSRTIPCEESSSLGWKTTKDDSSGVTYITTGAVAGGDDASFSITPENHYVNAPYELASCDSNKRCSFIGFLEDGLLGIKYPSLKVRFVRADDSLEMSLNNFRKASL